MAKPRKNDQIDETKRIMARLLKMPPKPYKSGGEPKPERRERSDKKPDRSPARSGK